MDRVLEESAVQHLESLYGRELVRVQARRLLDELRASPEAIAPQELEATVAELPERIRAGIEESLGGELVRVLNATGVLLHTNLGRVPLAPTVAWRLAALSDAYCDLELDLPSGRRGDRNRRAARLLELATGAEAALVVNNTAAALVLILSALARDREVIVSRGELVEIGGSFRIPEILTTSGARLVEVGSTNRTRLADYARAIGAETALILKVYPSNYRIAGFTASVPPAALAELARRHELPLVVDEGSGLLRRHPASELAGHPSFEQLLSRGSDLVCGSGDKVLGGPQAGLIAGSADLVGRLHSHPLYRALRPDRMTFAALEGALRELLAGRPSALDRLWPDAETHERRVRSLAERLRAAGADAQVVEIEAYVGGGSAPEKPIPGAGLAVAGGERLARALRTGSTPVVGYVRDDRLLLDVRTVDASDDELLLDAVCAAVGR